MWATPDKSTQTDQEELLVWFFQAGLRADENRFRQVQSGILDESTFTQLSSNAAYRLPCFAEFWAATGSTFAEDFQRMVESKFLPLSESYPFPESR